MLTLPQGKHSYKLKTNLRKIEIIAKFLGKRIASTEDKISMECFVYESNLKQKKTTRQEYSIDSSAHHWTHQFQICITEKKNQWKGHVNP